MRRYLLDTSVFITVERNYEPSSCTRFRNWLLTKNAEGKVFSIPAVYRELRGKKDGLSEWAEQHRREFFLPGFKGFIEAKNQVSDWAEAIYAEKAHRKFSEAADSSLVAYALGHKYIVVTYEKRAPTLGAGDIKIPDACDRLGIRCICLPQPKPHAAE